MDLVARLDEASARYAATWQPVDDDLYSLCRRRGHTEFADVYAKVCTINRVYMAGLQRGTTLPGKGDGEEAVAARLVESSGLVQQCLDVLRPLLTLDSTSMAAIVCAHGAITHDLAGEFMNAEPQSFVSKYLHFHYPIVPIYDERARVALGRWVRENHAGFRVTKGFSPPSELRSSYYRTFAGRFLLLWNEAQRVRPGTSIKVIDHALWEGRLETETPI